MKKKEKEKRPEITFSLPVFKEGLPDPSIAAGNLSFQRLDNAEAVTLTTTIVKNGQEYKVTAPYLKIGMVCNPDGTSIAAVFQKVEDNRHLEMYGEKVVRPVRLKLGASGVFPGDSEKKIKHLLKQMNF